MSAIAQLSCVLSILFASSPGLGAQESELPPSIHWKSGVQSVPRWDAGRTANRILELSARPDERHFLIQLRTRPTAAEREMLATGGVELLDPLGNGAYFATFEAPVIPWALAGVRSLAWAGEIQPDRKISELLADGDPPSWARIGESGAEDERAICVVLLHSDVDQDRAVAELEALGASVRAGLETINAVELDVPPARVAELAALDAVRRIEPPLPALKGGNYDAAEAVEANEVRRILDEAVADPQYGLDGSGVRVMVLDGGEVAQHADFGNRLDIVDDTLVDNHATHVAGTIGATGYIHYINNFQNEDYRLQAAGMAAGVDLESYSFRTMGAFEEGDLHTYPHDIEDDFMSAFGPCDLANASLWSDPGFWGMCNYMGEYGATSMLLDGLVRDLHATVVWIVGNGAEAYDPQDPNSSGCGAQGFPYHTIAPPGTAKNTISVGSIDTDMGGNDGGVSIFSGRGPSGDRIKPDLVAPGNNTDTGGLLSTDGTSGYRIRPGTSMAAPVVTGCLALLLEDMRFHSPGMENPLNSTFKAILVNTAIRDSTGSPSSHKNGGPTYDEGWGRIDIKAAIDLARDGNWTEGELSATGDEQVYYLDVRYETGSPLFIDTTLAWDDPPGNIGTTMVLVNDLNLRVEKPSGGRVNTWKLFPSSPGDQAQDYGGEDTTNNVEQVYVDVDSSLVGPWRIEVEAASLEEPQKFSLATDGNLVLDCNGNGVDDKEEIAAGLVPDCNGNGFPDSCDIEYGFADPSGGTVTLSSDCNNNGIPDDCEGDCNGNGIPDPCDIANGTATDCNGNGVLDFCDVLYGGLEDCNQNLVPDECELFPDCNGNGVLDECDITNGTESDCNGNGVPDSCDIASGSASDCNGNGIPDSCDIAQGVAVDCDGNGVPDSCDLASGSASDCNGNGIPDSCDIASGAARDCNGNGVPDACDVAGGGSTDVDGDGIPDECQTTRQVPGEYSTIADALDEAQNGDTILVAAGTYSGVGFENLVYDEGDTVYLVGAGPTTTVIDLGVSGIDERFLTMTGCGPNTRIEGFGFENGRSTRAYGGVLSIDGCDPTVYNCLFEDNTAETGGGAIHFESSGGVVAYCVFADNAAGTPPSPGTRGGALLVDQQSDVMVYACQILRNSAGYGGGIAVKNASLSVVESGVVLGDATSTTGGGGAIWAENADLEVVASLVTGNSSAHRGGGIYGTSSDVDLKGSIVGNNDALEYGGGVYVEAGPLHVDQCYVRDNSVTGTTAMHGGAGIRMDDGTIRNSFVTDNSVLGTGEGSVRASDVDVTGSTITGRLLGSDLTIRNSILWGGSGVQVDSSSLDVDYSDVEGGQAGVDVSGTLVYGANNLDENPKFEAPGQGDYHLKGTSPCINAGDPGFVPLAGEEDVDGEARVQNNRVDMGADEREPTYQEPPPWEPL